MKQILTLVLITLQICAFGQKKKIAQEAVYTAKEGTLVIVVPTYQRNIAAIEKLINDSTNEKEIERLEAELQQRKEFTTIFFNAATSGVEAYSFGKSLIVLDNQLKETKDSLISREEKFLILNHRNDVRELSVSDAHNQDVPGPFPQTFDGFAINLNNLLLNDIRETQADYSTYFIKSMAKLSYELDRLYKKYEYKRLRKKR